MLYLIATLFTAFIGILMIVISIIYRKKMEPWLIYLLIATGGTILVLSLFFALILGYALTM